MPSLAQFPTSGKSQQCVHLLDELAYKATDQERFAFWVIATLPAGLRRHLAKQATRLIDWSRIGQRDC